MTPLEDLAPFRVDPWVLGRLHAGLQLRVRRRRVRIPATRLIVLYPVAVFVALAAVALATGDLFTDRFRLADDLGVLLGGDRPEAADASAEFPLLRDVAVLAMIPLVGVASWLLVKQWSRLAEVVGRLGAEGVLDATDRDRFNAEIEDLNDDLAAIGRFRDWRGPALVGVAVASAAGLAVAVRSAGIYPGLEPAGWTGWTKDAYAGWWAGWGNGPGFFALGAVLAFMFYYLWLQNTVGLKVLGRFVTLHRAGNLHLRFRTLNSDGWYGWAAARHVLFTIYATVLVHLAVVGVLTLLLPAERLGVLVYVVLAVLIVAAYPFYLAVPLWLLHAQLRAYRQSRIAVLLASAGPDGDPLADDALDRRMALRAEIDYLWAIPTVPVRYRQVVVGAIVYAVPAVLALAEFARAN